MPRHLVTSSPHTHAHIRGFSKGAGLIYGTFHSIAFRLLKKYPTRAGLPTDFGVADEAETRKAVTYALKEAKKKGFFVATFQEFTPQQVGFRNDCLYCALCHRVLQAGFALFFKRNFWR